MAVARYELGIGVGGTVTDFVLRERATDALFVGKTLTTPADPAQGALAGLRRLLRATGVPAAAIGQRCCAAARRGAGRRKTRAAGGAWGSCSRRRSPHGTRIRHWR
jgi:hypothetical protein